MSTEQNKGRSRLRRLAALALSALLLLTLWPAAMAQSADDSVTTAVTESDIPEDAVHIASRDDWEELARSCRLDSWSVGKTVVLDSDIALGSSFTPIPSFGGTFDGQGHTISAMGLGTEGSKQGLFRYVQTTATIQNLTLQCRVAPDGSSCSVGGIAASNAGVIQYCHFTGLVRGIDYVGGIAAVNEVDGVIMNCSVQGVVYGSHYVGGITGDNQGVVRECTSLASVNTSETENQVELEDVTLQSILTTESGATVTDLGGIAGTSSGVIRACVNRGDVGYQHVGYNVGGIAGSQTGYIVDCANYGSIHGRKEAGGIVGQAEPETLLKYGTDTMQMVQSQMNTLTSQMNAMNDDAANMYNNKLANLQSNIDKANDALNKIKTYEKSFDDVKDDARDLHEDIWDSGSPRAAVDVVEDRITATMNDMNDHLNDAVNSATEFNSSITEEMSIDTIHNDLTVISNQLNTISNTLTSTGTRIRNRDYYNDLSDNDTASNTQAKVSGCYNYAAVDADKNAGGIVGAMAYENDLDPEDDITDTVGTESLYAQLNTRCVVTGCVNYGQISGKKESIGGVVGMQRTGLVKSCESYGPIAAPDAEDVGGIAGTSQAKIRSCAAKGTIEADSTVGGIAGSGYTITDCVSLVKITGGTEYVGAIAGRTDEKNADTELDDGEGEVTGNRFVENDDTFGVDGVSYDGVAWGVSYEELMALQGVPEEFSQLTVRFMVDGTQVDERSVDYGGSLTEDQMPELPAENGQNGHWEVSELTGITEDTVVNAVYSDNATVLASSRLNGEMPLVLVQGLFKHDQSLRLQDLTDGPVIEGATLTDCLQLEVTGAEEAQRTVRYCMPKQTLVTGSIWLRSDDGGWVKTDSTRDGSYLVFTMPAGQTDFAAVSQPFDLRIAAAAGGGVIVLLLLLVLGIRGRKRRRARKAAQQAQQSGMEEMPSENSADGE